MTKKKNKVRKGTKALPTQIHFPKIKRRRRADKHSGIEYTDWYEQVLAESSEETELEQLKNKIKFKLFVDNADYKKASDRVQVLEKEDAEHLTTGKDYEYK